MKTHELAKALLQFAKILNEAPNMEIGTLGDQLAQSSRQISQENLAVNLSTLAELSRVEKAEWVALIRAYNLPIEIQARDGSRNILGKLLAHLEKDAAAREALKVNGTRRHTEASPELMKALQSLLKD